MTTGVREFYVANAVSGVSRELTVVGRAGREPITVGTIFMVAYKEKATERGEKLPEHPQREIEKPIKLEVIRISAYGRTLAELPSHTTGSLAFLETDLSLAPPGWMLSER